MFKKIMVLLVAAAIAAASGCTPEGLPAGGVLNRALIGNPSMLNPVLSNDSASSVVCQHIYQGLVRYDEKMELVGQLAESWDISPDNLDWTFHLRRDVTWHDGQPFTARDVEFTITTIAFNADYPGSRVNDFALLEEVEVIDDYTIRFSLSSPWGPFLASLCQGIIPRHIFDPNTAAEADRVPIAEMARHPRNWQPVGTGPYMFSIWANDRYLTLERNDSYYADGPNIQTVCFKFYPDTAAAVSALEAGEVDLVADLPFSQAERVETELAETHSFYRYQDMSYEFLSFNFRPSAFGAGRDNPWLDRRVRQAVASALNRGRYVREILAGRGVMMDSPLPPASWAYSPEDVYDYAYNPDAAGQLLKEAGWKLGADGRRYKDGDRFTFQLTLRKDNALEMTMAEMIRADLEAVGIEMELNAVGWNEMLIDHVYAGDFHMLLMGLTMAADPDVYDIFHSTSVREGLNFGAYNNPELDLALKLGRQAGTAETRKELYAKVQRILTAELPYVFLFSRELTAAAGLNVQGIVPSPLGLCWPERWYIEENK